MKHTTATTTTTTAANVNTFNRPAASISAGNRKTGAIPSISLPPIVTCHNCEHCSKHCYALKHIYKLYPAARKSYDYNLDLYREDPAAYFDTVRRTAATARFFRWHVSGDIPDVEYLDNMVKVAHDAPGCHFMAFSKFYEGVDSYLDSGEKLPENLTIIFSKWYDLTVPKNPHNLPTSQVVDCADDRTPDQLYCPGNCAACCMAGSGCWNMTNGQEVAFIKH